MESDAPMRKTLILLSCLVLAGCVDDSATFYSEGREHALTIRRQQAYFWSDEAKVTLVAARMPQCQRLHALAAVAPADAVQVEIYAAGDDLWNVRLGKQLWQVETATCNGLTELEYDPKADLGQPLGVFSVQGEKLVFEPEAAPPAAPAGGQ